MKCSLAAGESKTIELAVPYSRYLRRPAANSNRCDSTTN